MQDIMLLCSDSSCVDCSFIDMLGKKHNTLMSRGILRFVQLSLPNPEYTGSLSLCYYFLLIISQHGYVLLTVVIA